MLHMANVRQEAQWNPMVEEQALDRVHRLGQKRSVTTYRYVVQESIEQVGILPLQMIRTNS